MTSRIVVTGGAIIRDDGGRILLQRRSRTLLFEDKHQESLQLIFTSLDEVDIDRINKVQKPVFMDLLQEKQGILR